VTEVNTDTLVDSSGSDAVLIDAPTNSKRKLRRTLRKLTPYFFVLPALSLYCGFVIYPMLDSLVISFTDWDGLADQSNFVGFENYRKIFEDPIASLALRNNLIWTVVMLAVPTVLGLLLALGLNRNFRGKTLFRSFFYAPAILPLVGVAGIWAWMLDPNVGLINTSLHKLGLGELAQQWLGNPNTALYSVMVAGIWQSVGFPMVLYLAGLQSIPGEQYEAARIDGAKPLRQFWHITLPWLTETHIVVVTLGVIASFKVFDLIYSMTYGGPGQATQVLASWMYFQTFQFYHAGYGSALTWMIALILLVVTIPYIRVMSRRGAA
jgi:raffinose/stachyose/melibiose transport system permease protein